MSSRLARKAIERDERALLPRAAAKARIKRSLGEKIFDACNVALMILLSLVTVYPFWYILVMSLNNGRDAAAGPIWLWPRVFTLDNYYYVFQYESMRSAFVVTIARCVLGSTLSVLVCMLAAYSLSKRDLPGRKAILYFLILPMFISGSIISTFVVYVKLGLMNNFLVYILPGAFAFFNMVVMRTFIEGIPIELEESAMLDGASYWQIFTRITVPLSRPIISAFLFFGFVGGWLDLYTNLIFVTKRSLYTLQYILYMVIKSSEARNFVDWTSPEAIKRLQYQQNLGLPTPEVIRMAVMVVVTFPILFIYPFFQKHFIKGMYVGAIKA